MRTSFKGKKVTMLGLGLLGRGVGVAKFLAENGADLIVTDSKSEKELEASLAELKKFKGIKFVLGEHRLEDFREKDLIVKAAGVPLDSPFVAEARKNKIPIEMDASLFARLAKGLARGRSTAEGVKIVGVTGTRGKSTVTHLLFEILKSAGLPVFLGGNVRGLATLPLLQKVKKDDIVVLELDSWQLQGFGDSEISPDIALFTTFLPDHLNYYKGDMEKYFSDKANIYRFQKKRDLLLMRPEVAKIVEKKDGARIKSKILIADKKIIPTDWKVKLLGEHNLENVALAVLAARELGVNDSAIKDAVEKFEGVPGRLQFIREVSGIKFYNDTTATTPDGVIAAMDSLKKYKGKIVLLGGGADKNLDYKEYAKIVSKFVKEFILFKGVASDKIAKELDKDVKIVGSMKEAMDLAMASAKKGDVVLLSPGAASFGVFKNEFDRGDQFDEFVKKIK